MHSAIHDLRRTNLTLKLRTLLLSNGMKLFEWVAYSSGAAH